MKQHTYQTNLVWTGNQGEGTKQYSGYLRDHEIVSPGKYAKILGSSDPSFRGNPENYNPEELFVSSLSSCHMLWYLHLCMVNHIVVESYTDEAVGVMNENEDGSGQFESVILNPIVIISEANDKEKALELHHEANQKCFIARSCNFPIGHNPEIKIAE